MTTANAIVSTKEALDDEQHSLLYSSFLHLAPGILITLFYLLVAPRAMGNGFPPMFAMLLAIIFVAIPVELGDLLRRGIARNGRLSLKGIVTYRRSMPMSQYVLIVLGFLILAALVSGAASLLDETIGKNILSWLPAWFFLNNLETYAGFSMNALAWTLAINLVLNGVAAPIVEELYFRGYLLPRLSRFGVWAPVINGSLFSLYHFWQPYAYLSIFCTMAPLAYLVWRKQNVRLGIIIHSAMNITGNLLLFAAILGK